MAAAELLAMARGAGAGHAQESLQRGGGQQRECYDGAHVKMRRSRFKAFLEINTTGNNLVPENRSSRTWPVLSPKALGPGRAKLAGTPEKPTAAPAAAAGAGAAAFLGAGAAAAATDGVCGLGCNEASLSVGLAD